MRPIRHEYIASPRELRLAGDVDADLAERRRERFRLGYRDSVEICTVAGSDDHDLGDLAAPRHERGIRGSGNRSRIDIARVRHD